MEPTAGEYVWRPVNSRPQIPPIFNRPFRLHTVKAAAFQGVLMTVFMAVAIIFKVKQSLLDGRCSNLTVLLFSQIALWMISLIYQHFFTVSHGVLREVGYNVLSSEFQRKSSYLYHILTSTNAIIVLYVAASITYAPSVICDWECPHSALNLTTYTILVEGVLFLIATYRYIRSINIFNSTELVPDVIATNYLNSGPDDALLNYDDQGEMLRRFIREQSFKIEYYKYLFQRLSHLGGVQEALYDSFANQD
uniref:Transmembrane protein 192 n=2 Tax=Lygus hesperus TaxID=30085 RepID=A0A0A9YVJ9_LYGHE